MKHLNVQRPLERKITLMMLKQQILTNWQWRVHIEIANHQITEINSKVLSWKLFNNQGSQHYSRLITGHHFLNSFQSKVNPGKISKNCTCGQVESVHHFLFTCQRYTRFRQKWLSEVFQITGDPDMLRSVPYSTAFGQRQDLSQSENSKLQGCIGQYIMDTQRFK